MAFPADRAADGAEWPRAAIAHAQFLVADPGNWEPVLRAVPARSCVIAFEDFHGQTFLLGSTSDGRAFASKRLCPTSTGESRADLSAVTTRIVVVPIGSAFEADLVYLVMARERMPRVHQQLMARASLRMVRLSGGDPFPTAAALDVEAAAGVEADCLVGPVEHKAAGRLAEAVVDAFDLCRYPQVLKQAPHGVACAYKEMGRCPAPCDGSESMDSYRGRVGCALTVIGSPPSARETDAERAMREAAAASRYEDAAAIKKQLLRVQALDAGPFKGVTKFSEFRHVAVIGNGKGRQAQLVAWRGGQFAGVWEDDEQLAQRLTELQHARVEPPRTPGEIETVGVLVKWFRIGASRRRVRIVRVTGDDDSRRVRDAVRAVTRKGSESDTVDIEEVEHARDA